MNRDPEPSDAQVVDRLWTFVSTTTAGLVVAGVVALFVIWCVIRRR